MPDSIATPTLDVPTESPFPIIRLMDVPIHAVTEREVITYILESLRTGRGGWVVTPNLDILRRLVLTASFRELVQPATLRVPDGMPLVWASRLKGQRLPERVTGSSLILSLTEAAAIEGRSVYFLGGDPGTAEQAGELLAARFPGLRLAGHDCPPLGFEHDPSQVESIRQRVQSAAPDIVFVALGSPKQEYLIDALRADLPATWWLGVGISFSFVTGTVRRAPRWIQRIGLEWFYRLCQEPGRLARRYLRDGIPFALRLFIRSLRERRDRAGQRDRPGPDDQPTRDGGHL